MARNTAGVPPLQLGLELVSASESSVPLPGDMVQTGNGFQFIFSLCLPMGWATDGVLLVKQLPLAEEGGSGGLLEQHRGWTDARRRVAPDPADWLPLEEKLTSASFGATLFLGRYVIPA